MKKYRYLIGTYIQASPLTSLKLTNTTTFRTRRVRNLRFKITRLRL